MLSPLHQSSTSYSYNNPVNYADPSGHCPNAVCEFGEGFFAQWASDIAAPVAPRLADALSVKADDSTAKVAGGFVGNLAAAAGAALEAAGGITSIGGGAAACGTVVLCFAGAPAMVAGATVTAHAGATVVAASQDAAKLGNILMAKGTGGADAQPNFRPGELDAHFGDHASEFGYKSSSEYLQGARNLIEGDSKDILTFTRKNGDTLFYNQKTNEFAVLANDNETIRTYFKPYEEMQYWLDQTAGQ